VNPRYKPINGELLALGGSASGTITIDTLDGDYAVKAIAYGSTGDFALKISSNAGIDGDWFGDRALCKALLGTAGNIMPIPMRDGIVLPKGTQITISVDDISGSTNNIFITFHAIKMN